MIVKPNRTDSYLFTFDTEGDPEGVEALRKLREQVKISNYIRPNKIRVELKGRLGKNNPNAQKYRDRNKGAGRVYSPYSRIPLADAQHVDVYINERKLWPY